MRCLLWGVVGLVVGCGGSNLKGAGGRGGMVGGAGGTVAGGAGGGVPTCVPGDSKGCTGPGACAGYQVCGGDGTYGACICGGGGAGGGGAGGSFAPEDVDGGAGAGGGGAGGSFAPEDVDGGAGWQAISAGVFTGCVTKAGTVSCWGDNRAYQFGTGTSDAQPVLTPEPAVTGLAIRQLAISGYGCGITMADELYCWGSSPTVAPLYMPGPTMPIRFFPWAKFKSVSAGGFACGVTLDGTAYCWGMATPPELGGPPNITCCDGGLLTYVDGGAPDPVSAKVNGGPWAMVSAGYAAACGVDANGDAYCWGGSTQSSVYAGILGDGDTSLHVTQTPVAVVGGHKFKWVYVGGGTSAYALGADNTPYCWSCDEIRTSAPPLRHADPFPLTFPAGVVIADIKSNAAATCALTTDGAVYCWGKNGRGDLGIGSADTMDHPTPERVINLPRIVAIAAGVGTCALSAAGNRYCWGNNDVGFLGSGATDDIYTPRALP